MYRRLFFTVERWPFNCLALLFAVELGVLFVVEPGVAFVVGLGVAFETLDPLAAALPPPPSAEPACPVDAYMEPE